MKNVKAYLHSPRNGYIEIEIIDRRPSTYVARITGNGQMIEVRRNEFQLDWGVDPAEFAASWHEE